MQSYGHCAPTSLHPLVLQPCILFTQPPQYHLWLYIVRCLVRRTHLKLKHHEKHCPSKKLLQSRRDLLLEHEYNVPRACLSHLVPPEHPRKAKAHLRRKQPSTPSEETQSSDEHVPEQSADAYVSGQHSSASVSGENNRPLAYAEQFIRKGRQHDRRQTCAAELPP